MTLKRRLRPECTECHQLWAAYRTIILQNVELGKALLADDHSQAPLKATRDAATEAKTQAHTALQHHISTHDNSGIPRNDR